MKKSGYVALLALLAAVAGALAMAAIYLNRREKELEEYEQILFSEDFGDEFAEVVDEAAADDLSVE